MLDVIYEVLHAALTALISLLICCWVGRVRPGKAPKSFEHHPEAQEALDVLNASWLSAVEIYRVSPHEGTVEVKVAEDMDHNREILDRHEARIAEALTNLESAAAALRETRARVYARKKPIETDSQRPDKNKPV